MTRSDEVEVEGYPCTCHVGLQGNFCKHRAKVLLTSGMADIQLVNKYGTHLGTEIEMPCQSGGPENQVGPMQHNGKAVVHVSTISLIKACDLAFLGYATSVAVSKLLP